LREADRGLDVGETVVEPDDPMDETGRLEALIAQQTEPCRELRVADEHHASFARGQDLVSVEAEAARVSEGPDLAPRDLRPVRLEQATPYGIPHQPAKASSKRVMYRPSEEIQLVSRQSRT